MAARVVPVSVGGKFGKGEEEGVEPESNSIFNQAASVLQKPSVHDVGTKCFEPIGPKDGRLSLKWDTVVKGG